MGNIYYLVLQFCLELIEICHESHMVIIIIAHMIIVTVLIFSVEEEINTLKLSAVYN